MRRAAAPKIQRAELGEAHQGVGGEVDARAVDNGGAAAALPQPGDRLVEGDQ